MRWRRKQRRPWVIVPIDLSTVFVPMDWRVLGGRGRGTRPRIQTRPLTLRDFVVGMGVNLVLYGPAVAGGVVGWRRGQEWAALGLGVAVAVFVQLLLAFLAVPIVALVRSRRRRAP